MTNPIGVFDSGVGGLTVVKEFYRYLPKENLLYFGDVARIPYGSKSPQEILFIVREIIDWMLTYNVKAVAMACNTSSALALETVRKDYDIPIFGLIKPTANYIKALFIKPKKIGVIATEATVKSKTYSKEIKRVSADIEVIEIACPGLVEIIEAGQINSPQAYKTVKNFIDPLIKENVDNIILGCTHYPFVAKVIADIYPKEKLLINPAEHMIKELKQTLGILDMLNNFNPVPNKYFCVSASPQQFIDVGNNFIPASLNNENVSLINPAKANSLESLAAS